LILPPGRLIETAAGLLDDDDPQLGLIQNNQRSATMSDDEVIGRYMRRFDRAVGAEPAALNELLESFSDDAVVNFDGTPYAGRTALLELYGRVLGPLVESCTHFTPERLPDDTVKVPWAASGRMSDGTVIAVAGTEYYTINDQGLITNLVNEPCGLPLTPGADEAPVG
jgi:hypothetical protein